MKGNAYWFSSEYKEGVCNSLLLSSDFSKEIFRVMSLPFEYSGEDIAVLSVINEDKLAVLFQRFALEMEIWITDEIDPNGIILSWNLFLAVDMYLKFRPGSEMLTPFTSFLIDEDNKVAVIWDTFNDDIRVYTVGENYYREIVIGKRAFDCLSLMSSYVPSLVQL